MTILIYSDDGAGPQSERFLVKSLKTLPLGNHYTLKKVDRHYIAHEKWEPHTSLLIFPGGKDTPYHEALKGSSNNKIRRYVENGGAYFGICAGGYYGSASIEFEKGHPLEVTGERELRFFPGTACGSAYGPDQFKYEDESGSRAANLLWKGEEPLNNFSIYFNGGCLFVDANKHSNTRVLAHYTDLPDSPAAIIECKVGKGKALLSGVHPEYAFSYIDRIPSIPKIILQKLKKSESVRQTLFQILINRLLSK